MQPAAISQRSFAIPEGPSRSFSAGFWAAACYMVLFIIRPWERLIPQLGEWKFERIIVGVMLLIVFKDGVSFRAQYKSVLAFFVAVLVSAATAYNGTLAWEGVYQYLPQVVFFLVMLSVIRQQRELNFMIVTFLAAMTLYMGKALWEFHIHGAHHVAMGVDRLFGIDITESDPNAFAMHIVCSMPLMVYAFRNRKSIAAQSPGWLRPILTPGLIGYALLGVAAVLQTQSRAGMLGLAAAVFLSSFSLVRGGKAMRAVMLAVILVGVLWIILPEDVRGRLRTIWNPSAGPANAQVSAEGRISGFYAGLQMFSRHPITGVGPGNFLEYRIRHGDGVPLIAHNVPGQVLGELGMLGGITFVLMIFLCYRNTRRTNKLARAFPGNPQMKQHAQLATACRNMIFLLLFFGMALHNNMKYDWLWVIAFAGLNFEFAKTTANRFLQFGQRRASQSGMQAAPSA